MEPTLMEKTMRRLAHLILSLALLAAVAVADDLPLGSSVERQIADGEAVSFELEVESAGYLTVLTRSREIDLTLTVSDESGMSLDGGTSDGDIGGVGGNERVVVLLPTAGRYRVVVSAYEGGSSGPFEIGASWIAFPSAERQSEPDDRAAGATEVGIGSQVSGTLDGGSGDRLDWVRIPVEEEGIVQIVVLSHDGDIQLEAFREADTTSAIQSSDRDLQGMAGFETLSLMSAGDEVFLVKIAAYGEGPMEYVVRVDQIRIEGR